jgi:dolichol-phosphate mannosyltransferase
LERGQGRSCPPEQVVITEKISIIVPSYNERDNVRPLLTRIAAALAGYDYEVIIVDDNSKDGTIDIVNSLTGEFPVRLLVRTQQRGLSTAVIHGLRHASGSIIGVMDADLQHPPEKLPDLVKAIESGADMAFGSRYVPGGGVPQWSALRRVISRGASLIAHLLLPAARRVKDPMSGFFMFRRDRVDPDALKPIGYKIALEILLLGRFENVVEVPFIFEDRSAGASKLKASTQIEYLRHILSLMVRTGEMGFFVKFIGVGLIGTGVNLGVYTLLSRLTGLSGSLDWVAVLIGIEVSIITNFILNDTVTFRTRRAGKSFIGRLLRFNFISLAGAGIQTGIFLLFTRAFGVFDILADFIGIVIAFLWNYFINRNWTWK